MRRSVFMAGILALVAGCDKANDASKSNAPATPSFDVGAKPPIVFQAFGSKDSTRLVPIAVVAGGQLKAIDLPPDDWHRLDSLYFSAGTEYSIFRDGRLAGTVRVTRRMWEPDSEPLYTLPGCRDARPMVAVTLKTTAPLDPAFELLGLTAPLAGGTAAESPFRDLSASARQVTLMALKGEQLDSTDIDTASFSARALHLAAGGAPTIAAMQIDANAGDSGPGAGHTTHFLILGDNPDGTGYRPTYKHVQSGEARTVEFQRLLDHLDVTGDGTDELFLESWRYASDNELVVLRRGNGRWVEALRVKQKWCIK